MLVEDCYQLGHITKPHGLKGELQVYLDVDFPENYANLESVLVEVDQQLIPYFISAFRLRGQTATVKFEGFNSLEEAEPLKSCALYLPIEQLPHLGSDQFYFHEIIDYGIVDELAGEIGKVKMVYGVGPQDLMATEYLNKEVLIPITNEIIKSVDRQNRQIHVHLPDGLLDIYIHT